MKTYTFAATDAPVQEHMAALVSALGKWATMAGRDSDMAITSQARDRNYGRRLAFLEVIEVIRDSNSF